MKMNKKKLFTMVVAVALVAVVGVGATLAYFTDTAEKTNVVTMGHVDIDLVETSDYEEKNIEENGIEFYNVMPGEVVNKVPTVSIADNSEDCYIRVKVVLTSDSLDGDEGTSNWKDGVVLDIDNNVWEKSGDYYYYIGGTQKLSNSTTGTKSVDLFSNVTIDPAWNNAYANKSFSIELVAEAIQADGFDGPKDVEGTLGWYDTANAGITAEKYPVE